MRFKNRSQRAAVMAQYRSMGFSNVSAKYYTKKGLSPETAKNSTFKQLEKKGIWLKYSDDKDGDGIRNIKDCRPLDPKRVGVLHDWKMKRLKAQEEKLEKKRERAEDKLSDLEDELKIKQKISKRELDVKTSELSAKQAIIEQMEEEKKKQKFIENESKRIKEEMDNYTWSGKAKKFLKHTGEVSSVEAKKFGGEVKRRWNSEEAKKNRANAAKYANKGFKKLWKSIK